MITLEALGTAPPCESGADWNGDGVVVLPGFFAGSKLLELYVDEWKEEHGYRGIHDYDGMPMLLADHPKGWVDACPYMDHLALRALCCDGELAQVLRGLTGDDMAVNLNLTTWLSTERDWHADSYLNEPEVGDWYAAVWIALDDIHPDSGVFQYVPGSHRWPQITRTTIEEFFNIDDPAWPKLSERLLTPLFTEEIRRRWAPVVSYVPEKGDVLIWHGRLLHRGSKPAVHGIARPALIAHYSGIHHRPAMPKARRHVLGGHYFPDRDTTTGRLMTWLNVGCGTWRADPPWINLDVADNDEVHPDVLCTPGEPLPYDDGVAELVFAGHVFEHTAWEDIPRFVAELARVLEPGGKLLVVGPDVHRAIRRYAQGTEPWEIVIACLEHVENLGFQPDNQWPNARHHWNCDEGRVVMVLEQSGCFSTVKPLPVPDHVIDRGAIPPWPIVGFTPWQAAVLAVK